MKLSWRFLGLLLPVLFISAALFSGCETPYNADYSEVPQPSSVPASAPASAGVESGRFMIGDTVTVLFSGPLTPPPPHEEQIKEDGTVTLDLIGAVKAVGKTPGELQREIQELYVPKYYLRLTVTVNPKERNYTVGGEVKSTGPKLWFPGTTVVKAIQAAGDFTDYANKRNVTLTRANGTKISVNVKKALTDRTQDPLVFPGDTIYVKRSYF